MNYYSKVKNKKIDRSQEIWILKWDILLLDKEWVYAEPDVWYKFKIRLNNDKKFMKKLSDRSMNIRIKKNLSLLEKELLLDILDYIDDENTINFQAISSDYEYAASKMSKVKKLLAEKGIIKKDWNVYYLNPMIWYKWTDISQRLLLMFEKEFYRYWVNVTTKF